MVLTVSIVFIIGITFYFLYINGFMWMQKKRAVTYVGSMKGNKASFTSCTGYMKRVIRFKESKTCHLLMETELSNGDVSVEILDSEKQLVANLSSHVQSGDFDVEKGKRYYLIIRFRSATGGYVLHWNQ